MGMPAVLKNFNVFNDANSYMTVAEEIKLPKLSRKMEDHRAGGMNAPVDIDLGQEKLEMEMTLAGIVSQVFEQYATPLGSSVPIRFAGAYQQDDTGDVIAVEIIARGRHKEIDFGDTKAGDKGKFQIKTTLTYYKLSINGKEVIEIDVLNMIEKVNGVDRLAEQRKAVGLA